MSEPECFIYKSKTVTQRKAYVNVYKTHRNFKSKTTTSMNQVWQQRQLYIKSNSLMVPLIGVKQRQFEQVEKLLNNKPHGVYSLLHYGHSF